MDIIVSAIMIIASIYLYVLVGAESPAPTATELGAAFWPHIILALIIILSVVNLVQSVKKLKAEGGKIGDDIKIGEFFKSRLFIGIVLVIAMALILPIIGFVPTCFIFLIAYGILLKADNVPRLALISLIITVVLYMLFQGVLDIFLPRGIGVLRDFALMLESILPF